MPLPQNEQVVETAGKLVQTLHGAWGEHPGYRPSHARGKIVTGTFTPTAEAAGLSKAQHFNSKTPVICRFSNSTGIPDIPDNDGNANPRGFATRFVLSDDGHKHTDIVAHSVEAFPVQTGEQFLQMLQAMGGGTVAQFLEENPAAAHFLNMPKPFPVSFATQKFFGQTAFKLISKDGKETYVRYFFEPVAGYQTLSDDEVKSKSKDYLFDELAERLSKQSIEFKLLAQIGEEGDPTNDSRKNWPESRAKVELGTITLDKLEQEPHNSEEQRHIIYDPIPRVDGVDVSDDPLLDMRAAIYLISGKERRAAKNVSTATVT